MMTGIAYIDRVLEANLPLFHDGIQYDVHELMLCRFVTHDNEVD